MNYQHILYSVENHIATITLNRPEKLNAWTSVMEDEVRLTMRDAGTNKDVRVILLTGAGRGFCPGADISWLGSIAGGNMSGTGEAAIETVLADGSVRADFQTRHSYFPAIPKPIIAVINGACAALGLILSQLCDIRFAADSATFTTAFARRGLVAEGGLAWLLPRTIGPGKAADLLFSARRVDAEEALKIGLVDRVYASAELMPEAVRYATQLASQSSPRSLRIMKRQLWNAAFQTLGETINEGWQEISESFASSDFREGVAAFAEKRAPQFTGL